MTRMSRRAFIRQAGGGAAAAGIIAAHAGTLDAMVDAAEWDRRDPAQLSPVHCVKPSREVNMSSRH